MGSEKPQDINGYKKWLKDKLGVDLSDRTRTHYESVADKVKKDLEASNFWNQLRDNLKEYNDEYLIKTGYLLFIAETRPEIDIKTYDSFLLKTFRRNILDNKNWPNAPGDGWILPDNWYTRVNDIIRTLIVVKYLDGVGFIQDKIKLLCDHHHQKCRVFLEAREEGYYAAHLYTEQSFEIPKITWDTETVDISIEIQITTQLQEVIRKLLHKYYEGKRKGIREVNTKWQWNYKNDEFVANYLGHILHYIEGMIMEVRERQGEMKGEWHERRF